MPRKPILIGVDASPEAAGAAALGYRLAQLTGARCHLIHAVRDLWTALAAVQLPDRTYELNQAFQNQARKQVAAVLEDAVPREVIDKMIVRLGRAAVVIEEAATELGVGLIVLGGKHHTALGRWLGGSTSLNVVRTAKVPVLVTAKPGPEIERVMVAVDFSPAARPTIKLAEHYAELFEAKLRALNVMEPLPIVPEVPPVDPAEYYELSEELLKRDIWPLVTSPGAERIARHGMVVDTLLRETTEWPADLLVVGSHGKGWAQRVLLGSVTEQLLNHLPTSLLVVPVAMAADVAPEAVAGERPQARATSRAKPNVKVSRR